jgi:6-phosphogluconolactonase
MSVHIYSTPQDLASAAADYVASCIENTDRQMTLGLAGGSTPESTYERLAEKSVDWSQVVLWLGDERWVPHDHPESNTRMARAALADKVIARLLAPDAAFGEPAAAAAAYSEALGTAFFENRPDLVLLGIGDDGHTASLFPGSPALTDDSDIYLANWIEGKQSWRLTASMALLWSARELVFLVQGEGKAKVLSQIIDQGLPFPAQRVASGADAVRWMVDEAAASHLSTVPR